MNYATMYNRFRGVIHRSRPYNGENEWQRLDEGCNGISARRRGTGEVWVEVPIR